MHAVVIKVNIVDRERAQAELRDQVVPMVSGIPGFVAGYWVAVSESEGRSLLVFESEQAASGVAEQIRNSPRSGVEFQSAEVGEVVAHA